MIPTTINLVKDAPSGTPTAADYSLLRYTADGSERLLDGADLIEPDRLVIRHSQSGNGLVIDRHLVQVTKTFADADGKTYNVTVNVTFTVPRVTAVTAADVRAIFTAMATGMVDSDVLHTNVAAARDDILPDLLVGRS